MKKIVSVIFSVYGFKPGREIKVICDSIRHQSVPCEIILAEQSLHPNNDTIKFCNVNKIQYVHSLPNINKDKTYTFNPGRARNAGLKRVVTKYIYFTDSDIFFEDKNYLKKLLSYVKTHPLTALIRPQIKRLSVKTTKKFLDDYEKNITIKSSRFVQNCYIDYNQKINSFSPTYKYERYSLIHNILHVTPNSKFKENRYNPNHFKEFQWSVLSHFGGLFCTKELFQSVGGYTEDYITWGMEDTDIQWKFDNYSGVQLIDNIIGHSALIHFEHQRRCQNNDYTYNYKVFEKRKKMPFTKVLKHDISNLIGKEND